MGGCCVGKSIVIKFKKIFFNIYLSLFTNGLNPGSVNVFLLFGTSFKKLDTFLPRYVQYCHLKYLLFYVFVNKIICKSLTFQLTCHFHCLTALEIFSLTFSLCCCALRPPSYLPLIKFKKNYLTK